MPSNQNLILNLVGFQVPLIISGTGPPIILLHTQHSFAKYLSLHLATPCQIITFDIPGFYLGHPTPAITNLDQFNLCFDALFAQLRLKKAIIIGECIGSVLALEYAHHSPQNIDKLFLIAPPLRLYSFPSRQLVKIYLHLTHRLPSLGYYLLKFFSRKTFKLIGDALGGYGTDRPTNFAFDPQVVISILYYAFKANIYHLISTNPIPTLYLTGNRDYLNHPSRLHQLIDPNPNSKHCSVPKVNHSLVIRHPDRVFRYFKNFLDKISHDRSN